MHLGIDTGNYLIEAGNKAKDKFGWLEAVKFYNNSLSFIKDNEQLKKVGDGFEEILSVPTIMKKSLDKYVFSLGKEEDRLNKQYLNEKLTGFYDHLKNTLKM